LPTANCRIQSPLISVTVCAEEAAVGPTAIVPYLLEDRLVQLGGNYSKVDDWQAYAVTAGLLITGQNPASPKTVAAALLNLLA